jgi:hypothetical protein
MDGLVGTQVVSKSSSVNTKDRMWARLLASTGQPTFNKNPIRQSFSEVQVRSPGGKQRVGIQAPRLSTRPKPEQR